MPILPVHDQLPSICAGSIDSAVLVSKKAESRLDLEGSLKRTFKVLGGALVILKEIP